VVRSAMPLTSSTPPSGASGTLRAARGVANSNGSALSREKRGAGRGFMRGAHEEGYLVDPAGLAACGWRVWVLAVRAGGEDAGDRVPDGGGGEAAHHRAGAGGRDVASRGDGAGGVAGVGAGGEAVRGLQLVGEEGGAGREDRSAALPGGGVAGVREPP